MDANRILVFIRVHSRSFAANLLRCGGTPLLANLLLMVKVIALSLLLTTQFATPAGRIAGAASAAALFLNRWVRISSIILGCLLLWSPVRSEDKLLCGAIFIVTGLHIRGREPSIVRYLIAVAYLGAGLSRLLSDDGGAIAAGELVLGTAFLFPKLYFWAIWANILFSTSILVLTGSTNGMLFYTMMAVGLAFARWPHSRLLVIYDGDCGFCTRTKEWWERFDLEGLLDWQPFQSGVARQHGIPDAAVQERLHLVTERKIYAGFAAFRLMLLYNPITYLVMVMLLAAPFRRWFAAILLLFFSPLFSPIGEFAYNWIARNRHRLSASSCKVQND